jgi:hypothetical protein
VDYNSEDGGRELDKTYRDSQSAYLPLPDGKSYKPLACIEKRASELQGHEPIPHMENLQVVRYHPQNLPFIPFFPAILVLIG